MKVFSSVLLSGAMFLGCQGAQLSSMKAGETAAINAPQMFSGFIAKASLAKGTCLAPRAVVTEQGQLAADLPSFANPSFDEQKFASVLATQVVASSAFETSVSGLTADNAIVSHDYSASENTSPTDLAIFLQSQGPGLTISHGRTMLYNTRIKPTTGQGVDSVLTSFGKDIKAANAAIYAAETDKTKALQLIAENIFKNCGDSYVAGMKLGQEVDTTVHVVAKNEAGATALKNISGDINPATLWNPEELRFTANVWATGLTEERALALNPELKRIAGTQHGFTWSCDDSIKEWNECKARLDYALPGSVLDSSATEPLDFYTDRYYPYHVGMLLDEALSSEASGVYDAIRALAAKVQNPI